MLRTKLSKFKQVIAVAVIPRILIRDIKPIKNRLHNYTLNVFNIARKSTDSGSNDDENEKRKQIIEKCFGETPKSSESKDLKDDLSEMEKENRNIVSSDFVRMSDAEKVDVSSASDKEPSYETSGMQAEEASVRATTANIVEETLKQKLETIVETPHVEASPENIEGFNSTPKVLGHDIEFFADEKIQHIDLDDLAKRCVGATMGNIDEMLIKEMKNMANNDNNSQPDMTLIKSHGVEKYYSGIFEHLGQQTKKPQQVDDTPKEPLHLFYDNKIIAENEIKSERLIPLHIDAVHLFAYDEGSKDYKESGIFRDSSVYLSSEIIEDPSLDFPSIISPYESPVMPFYEYVNKEQIILGDFGANETMTIADTVTDARSVADIPPVDKVLLRKEDTDKPSFVIEKHEMDSIESEPTVTHSAKPILQSKLKKESTPNEIGNLSREQLLNLLYIYNNPAIKKTEKSEKSHVFSTTTDTPTIGINPSPNSSISGTYTPGAASKDEEENVDMPVNSAISANQNPGEYYNMSSLKKGLTSNVSEQLQTLTAESHIIHAFCTQLQEMEEGVSKETEDSIMILEYPYPFSYVLFEPEMKGNIVKDVLTDKVPPTTKKNVTKSIKNEAKSVDDNIPLSQILKRIREKNRLELCRNLLLQNAKPERSTKFTCMALESNKQKNSPRPCQPPPKPPKEKCPKPCPPPCPPKKDPCAKLIPFFLNTVIRFDVSCDIQFPIKQYNDIYYYKTMLTDDIIERLRKLGETLRFVKVDRDTNDVKDATCARDYEPWIPIPSWPVPKVVKKRPFVCPKEGCKPAPVPRSNPPKQRPCLGVPKKSFSFSQLSFTPVNNPDVIFINL